MPVGTLDRWELLTESLTESQVHRQKQRNARKAAARAARVREQQLVGGSGAAVEQPTLTATVGAEADQVSGDLVKAQLSAGTDHPQPEAPGSQAPAAEAATAALGATAGRRVRDIGIGLGLARAHLGLPRSTEERHERSKRLRDSVEAQVRRSKAG